MLMLGQRELLDSPVVANCRMNRERRLSSYREELRMDPIAHLQPQREPAWLDLCCGQARALREARSLLPRARIEGLDLIEGPGIHVGPLEDFEPETRYDLITCVHGLHYVGDKLHAIARAVGWLKPEGLFLAHLDLRNLRWEDGREARKALHWMRSQGLIYGRDRLLKCHGAKAIESPFQYVGADDTAGPNYTGQPAVNSIYRA